MANDDKTTQFTSKKYTVWHLVLACLSLLLGACTETVFTPRPCDPGDLECTGNGFLRSCNATGTAWISGSCAEDQVCIPGECDDPTLCPDTCKDQICEPGDSFCGGNSVFIYGCDATGTDGCYVSSCASPPVDGICYEGSCVAVCGEGQKSYLGCEYFAVDLDNAFVDCDGSPGGDFCDASEQQFSVVVSNPDPNLVAHVIISKGPLTGAPIAEGCQQPGTLSLPDNFVDAALVPPKGLVVFNLPSRNANATLLETLAYRVGSNIPMTVYQFNPLENVQVFSNDASVLLPTTSAGQNYYIMSRAQFSDALRGFMTVVGISDETEVSVTPTAPIYPGKNVEGMEAGETRTFILSRFDVLNLEPSGYGADLTGSFVTANKPVIVFSGHEAANAPTPTSTCKPTGVCEDDADKSCTADIDCLGKIPCCADHLEQQLFPVFTWGKDYLAVRSYPRGEELDIWRLLASQDGTEVILDPSVATVPTLNAGQWYEFESDKDFVITATKRIMVGQFLAGEKSRNAGIGDPAFMLSVPQRQFRDSYVFLAPGKSTEGAIGYAEDYVSIAVINLSGARLDGTSLEELVNQKPGIVLTEAIGSSQYTAVRIPIEDGFHNLVCPDFCSVMVHGYDQFVSYGYPGGLNLLECSTDGDCRFPEVFCREDFVCVECLSHEDCPEQSPQCLDSGRCE
jgi:hypothetical protein